MKRLMVLIWLILCAQLHHTLAQKLEINTKLQEFYDESRDRIVLYKVYFPNHLDQKYPVIIFSHGLGGTRNAARYLGEYLAERGYICFHIQHPGSDNSIWQGSTNIDEARQNMTKSLENFKNAENRFKDIPFVIDQLAILNAKDDVFKGRLNLEKIGLMGHSYGAKSTLVAAGEKLGGRISFKEKRVKAGVALSPNLPPNAPRNSKILFEEIDIPLFHMTGTKDGDPLGRKAKFSPEDRTVPYQTIDHPDQYLLVLDQATHNTFGGGNGGSQKDPFVKTHLSSVQQGVCAFFDFYLKQDQTRGTWLKQSYKKVLSDKDHFEWK